MSKLYVTSSTDSSESVITVRGNHYAEGHARSLEHGFKVYGKIIGNTEIWEVYETSGHNGGRIDKLLLRKEFSRAK